MKKEIAEPIDTSKAKRITELIDALKDKGIKQYAVAEALGVTETAVSAWKNGRRNMTEQTDKGLCREFGVDYIWLTTGEGEMFVESDDDFTEKIDRIMAGENDKRKNLFKALINASDEDIEALDRIIELYKKD